MHFVLARLRKEDSLEGVAHKLCVSGSTLSHWREEHIEAGMAELGSSTVIQNALGRRVEEVMPDCAQPELEFPVELGQYSRTGCAAHPGVGGAPCVASVRRTMPSPFDLVQP